MYYIILLSLISLTLADVTLYKYKPYQTVYINNKKIRETIDSQYFAYPGYHKLDFPTNYSTSYFKTNRYFFGSSIIKDYVITKKTNIGSIKFYLENTKNFHYIINVILSHSGLILLYHNNIPIFSINSKTISIYNNMILEKGYHNFNLEIKGDNICSCPSSLDGYQQTRYFFGWIENNIKNKTKDINTKINNLLIPYLSIKIKY